MLQGEERLQDLNDYVDKRHENLSQDVSQLREEKFRVAMILELEHMKQELLRMTLDQIDEEDVCGSNVNGFDHVNDWGNEKMSISGNQFSDFPIISSPNTKQEFVI